jgi:hypothetical protein
MSAAMKNRTMYRCKCFSGFWLLICIACGLTGCESASSDFGCPLPGGFQLVRTATQQVQVVRQSHPDGSAVIPANVLEIANDGRIILAKRQNLATEGDRHASTEETPVDGAFEYWILDTEKPATYGPLSEDEYTARRRELHLADRLRLRGVQSYSDQWKLVGLARYNVYYWLTFVTPAIIMLLAAFVRRTEFWWALAVICFIGTTNMSGESIWTKWSIRRELFPEIHFQSTGNQVFSYVIAPFEGLLYTGFFALIYFPIRRLAKKSHSKTDRRPASN